MKKVISLVAGALFVCTLFFNVSLIQNENGDNSLSLDSLQTAQAQDGEGCIDCPPDCHPEVQYVPCGRDCTTLPGGNRHCVDRYCPQEVCVNN